jgi:hypothetical protein
MVIFLVAMVPVFISAMTDKSQDDKAAAQHEQQTDASPQAQTEQESAHYMVAEHDDPHATETGHLEANPDFPPKLDSYDDFDEKHIGKLLLGRIKSQPFNIVATLIFLLAIIHTFLTSVFADIAHKINHHHDELIKQGLKPRGSVNVGGELLHFFGEVEAVFGIWAAALVWVIAIFYDWHTATGYIAHTVDYTEPLFVVTIMILASSRPILKLAELALEKIANLFGGSLSAWWMTILIVAPLLGSFITEPAAMTISAVLLSNKFYELEPSLKFRYATLGLLFVNVSVGGTLTHFAAPPVLMVSEEWHWGLGFMLGHFGWKAAAGIILSTVVYYFVFKKEMLSLSGKFSRVQLKELMELKYFRREHLDEELSKMDEMIIDLGFPDAWELRCNILKGDVRHRIESEFETKEHIDKELFDEVFQERFEEERIKEMRHHLPGLLQPEQRAEFIDPDWDKRPDKVPAWIMIVHVLFLIWTVWNAHHPALFMAGLLFFVGFAAATPPFQNRLDLKPPLLVGFFLAGLVIHGGLQAWWIAPILNALQSVPLMITATVLTAFNDNAAITYLSTLVPNFSPAMKYAVVSGAVTGGGLTVIANAPNPAGQSILKKYFPNGVVSPAGLVKAAILPTIVMFLIFVLIFG